MAVTWRRLIEFSGKAQTYLSIHPEETKLRYAINRVMPRIERLNDRLQEKLADIDIEHCITEKHGEEDVIMRDQQGLRYSKDGMKQRNQSRSRFLDNEVDDFEPYFATAIPDTITIAELDAFESIVIKPADAERIFVEYEARAGESESKLKLAEAVAGTR